MNEESQLTVFDGYDKQKVEVLFQEEANLEITVPLFYVNSGKKELESYVEEICKPCLEEHTVSKQEEIDTRVEEVHKPALAEYTQICQNNLFSYVETVSKTDIDTYVETEVQPYSEQAKSSAAQALASEQAAASSAEQASNIVNEFDTHAADKQSAFDINAATKQASVDASTELARKYAQGTIEELSSGSSKYWSEKAKENAESIDMSSFAKVGANNTFTGVNIFNGSNPITIKNTFSGSGTMLAKATDINAKGSSEIHGYYTSSGDMYTRVLVKNTTAAKDAYLDLVLNDNGSVKYRFGGNASYSLSTSSNTTTDIPNTKFVHDVVNEAMSKVFGAGHIGQIGYTARTSAPEGCAWCDGAEYTKAMFPDVYQMLVEGKLQKTDYTTYNNLVSSKSYCEKFALDTTNQKFKVPKLLDRFIAQSDTTYPVVGNGSSIGLINGSDEVRSILNVRVGNASDAVLGQTSYNATIGASQGLSSFSNNAKVLGVSTNASQSGLIAENNTEYAIYRAYVVLYSSAVEASTAQAAEFIESLSTKANVDLSNVSSNIDYVVESGTNYMKFKSKKLIQWGYRDYGTATPTINFVKPFSDTSYIVTGAGTNSLSDFSFGISNKTTTSFSYKMSGYNDSSLGLSWIAIGQGA